MVGDVDSTLHWCSNQMFARVTAMHKMSLKDLHSEFQFGSRLDRVMVGIMDVMFVASCFEHPYVLSMENMFWIFAQEIILVRASNVDHLNLLLWRKPLPQTVIMLDPIPYFIDSMIPHIDDTISIQGTVVETDDGETSSILSARTLIMVPSTSTLVFRGNVRLSVLQVMQFETSGGRQMEYVMSFIGSGVEGLTVSMQAVDVRNAGCFIAGYSKLSANHFGVTNATTALSARDVDQIYLTATHKRLADNGFNSWFSYSDVAFDFFGVSTFIGTDVFVFECHVICDVKMKKIFVLENSKFHGCTAWGEILSAPTCSPSLYHNEVLTFAVILHFLFCILL